MEAEKSEERNDEKMRMDIERNTDSEKRLMGYISISYIDQQNVYYYTPKRTGTYGFSFGINNAENSYRISLLDSKNEVIFDTYSSNECKEVELKKNQKYRLHVNYSRGFEKYKISIKQI